MSAEDADDLMAEIRAEEEAERRRLQDELKAERDAEILAAKEAEAAAAAKAKKSKKNKKKKKKKKKGSEEL